MRSCMAALLWFGTGAATLSAQGFTFDDQNNVVLDKVEGGRRTVGQATRA